MEAVVRKQTSFRLREDLLQILQEHAKKANRSLNNFVESTLMDAMYSEPNEETVAAINEARSGKRNAGVIDTTDFGSFKTNNRKGHERNRHIRVVLIYMYGQDHNPPHLHIKDVATGLLSLSKIGW